MKFTDEEVISFAESKSIRENRKIWIYESKNGNGDYFVSPQELDDEGLDLLRLIEPEDVDSANRLQEIKNYKSIKEGDQVLVNGSPEHVVKVTPRQIETHTGKKFRKSDGTEWGKEDGLAISKRIVF